MAEFESSVRERLVYSRLIAVCFVAELLQRKAWREKLRRIKAFHTLALAQYLTAVQWTPTQEPLDLFSTALRDSRVRQAEQLVAAVLQVLREHEEERPFCIRCYADMH